MPGLNEDQSEPLEAQDRAESYDETNLSESGEQRRTFEEMDEVLDVTSAEGDADADELNLDAGDYDPDDLTSDDLEEDEDDVQVRMGSRRIGDTEGFDEDDPGADSVDGLRAVGDGDRVSTDAAGLDKFQPRGVSDEDLARMGYATAGTDKPQVEPGSGASADDVEDNRDRAKEKELDHGLKETFPASDPVSINPGAD